MKTQESRHAPYAIERFLQDTLFKFETAEVRHVYDVCNAMLKTKQQKDKELRDKAKKGKSKGKDIKVERGANSYSAYDEMADFM